MNSFEAAWPDDYHIHQQPGGLSVPMATLVNVPERMQPYETRAFIAQAEAKRAPTASLMADWRSRELDRNDGCLYVPMNTSGVAVVEGPNTLVTSNLNGCTAIAAAYRHPETDNVHLFLGHYDAESVRQTHEETGRPILSTLVGEFAGSQAVRVAVAYAKEFNPTPPEGFVYEPEDYPVEAMMEDFQSLPGGSSVLRIPYGITRDPGEIGHVFYAERGGSDLIRFGFNALFVRVGEPEVFSERRRAIGAALQAEAEAEYDMDFGEA